MSEKKPEENKIYEVSCNFFVKALNYGIVENWLRGEAGCDFYNDHLIINRATRHVVPEEIYRTIE